MEPVKFKKIQLDDVYTSALTARLVTNEDGWTRMELVEKKKVETGQPILDAAIQPLASDCALLPSGVAQSLGVCVPTLCEIFVLFTGMTTSEFFAAYRFKRACEWLACTDLEQEEVAKRSGYASQNAMSQSFLRRIKISPWKYRHQYRPENFRDLYRWQA